MDIILGDVVDVFGVSVSDDQDRSLLVKVYGRRDGAGAVTPFRDVALSLRVSTAEARMYLTPDQAEEIARGLLGAARVVRLIQQGGRS